MTTIKKADSTFFVENEYTDKNGQKQTAIVTLEVGYINKKCSIKPTFRENFLFVHGDLNKWIAVANCIRNAAEFAKIELEEKDTIPKTMPEINETTGSFNKTKIVYNHEGPEMGAMLSNDEVLTNDIITYVLPVSFDASSSYVFEGEYNSYSIGEALNHFRSFINERIKIGKVDNNEVFYLVFTTYKKWAISPLPMKNDILIAKYEHSK